MKKHIEKEANRIADAIVELVERADGPVTLTEVNRAVAGFAANEPPFYSYVIEHAGDESVYWSDMTEAGEKAFEKVLLGRRIAIQFVNPLLYFLAGGGIMDENWRPIVLLPARAANLDSPKWLMRGSQDFIAIAMSKPGWRPLTPGPVRYTADQFSL